MYVFKINEINGTKALLIYCKNTQIRYLEETNIVGVLAEALTAQVKTVLANEGRALSADAAVEFKENYEKKRRKETISFCLKRKLPKTYHSREPLP